MIIGALLKSKTSSDITQIDLVEIFETEIKTNATKIAIGVILRKRNIIYYKTQQITIMLAAIIISAIFVGLFFGNLVMAIVSERKYQSKRKLVVAGAKFKYYNGNNYVEVEVIEDKYLCFTVRYRIVGEELIREMHTKDFVTVYLHEDIL